MSLNEVLMKGFVIPELVVGGCVHSFSINYYLNSMCLSAAVRQQRLWKWA